MADIFISYAHLDNQPLYGGQNRWVKNLHQDLETRLAELLGMRPRIWRDPRLEVGDLIEEMLNENVAKADILLTIVSPSYLKSDWCKKELEAFCASAARKGGVRVGNKSRIIKIERIPVERELLHRQFEGSLDAEFFKYDQETTEPLLFDPLTSHDDYHRSLTRLCIGIKNLIKHLEANPPQTPETIAGKVVYLATVTSDRESERKSIESELTQHGYTVDPVEELKGNAGQIEEKVRELMSRAKLSVHLLGSFYGLIPERGGGRSLARLQHDMAMERNGDPNFKRLVWIPIDLKGDETEQESFIKDLRENNDAQLGAEILSDKLEDVKTRIHELLERPPTLLSDNGNQEAVRIYLVYDRMDYDDVKPLADFLYHSGFEVMPPPIKGDAAQVMQLHQESLMNCDAMLVYYSRVGDTWANLKRQEMYKLRGMVRPKPILAKAFYISGDKTDEKDSFRSNEFLVLKHFSGFSPDSLTPFLDLLRNAKGGQR